LLLINQYYIHTKDLESTFNLNPPDTNLIYGLLLIVEKLQGQETYAVLGTCRRKGEGADFEMEDGKEAYVTQKMI